MAPNLKHVPLHAHAGLTSKVVVAAAKEYQRPTAPVADSASYWEWNEPSDVLSTNHIVSNLIAASAIAASGETIKNTDTTTTSSDDYWAERVEDDLHDQVATLDRVVSRPLQQEQEPANYWHEASHARTASDNYWNTSPSLGRPQLPTSCPVTVVRNPALNQDESASYWQERSFQKSSAKHDAYWRECRPDESADGSYWTWKASELSESDKYWAWPTPPALSSSV